MAITQIDLKEEATVIFNYECVERDGFTDDVKRIAFDPDDVTSIEQCWLQEAVNDDEVVKIEVCNVSFRNGAHVVVRAKFDDMMSGWKLSKGWPVAAALGWESQGIGLTADNSDV